MTSVRIGGGLTTDVTSFRDFAVALRTAQPALSTSLRLQLRAVGELVAAEARSRFAEVSTSVPPTVRVSSTANLQVSVTAGGKGALAGLLELGGSSGGASWRHPLFGDTGYWYEQSTHPSLYPALDSKADEAEVLVGNALDDALRIAAGEV
ncbi:MAG TPA: hypothetical protein VGP46_09835 [Acidimicrobiales bacterium]|jgi:hypothetical protein|nr:hypothetical protein [Acidimicrobiales bacterium]